MKLLGLTGGVGMGKSTSAAFLARYRIPVIDTDRTARELVEPGQPALMEIVDAFGASMIDTEGRLRRDALAAVVFENSGQRQRLEEILHPRIRSHWQEQVEGWRVQNVAVGVVIIPLLFETHAEDAFDAVVTVACLSVTQHSRLSARGWSGSQIEARLASQWPIGKKLDRADFVLWTEGEVSVVEQQWEMLLKRI